MWRCVHKHLESWATVQVQLSPTQMVLRPSLSFPPCALSLKCTLTPLIMLSLPPFQKNWSEPPFISEIEKEAAKQLTAVLIATHYVLILFHFSESHSCETSFPAASNNSGELRVPSSWFRPNLDFQRWNFVPVHHSCLPHERFIWSLFHVPACWPPHPLVNWSSQSSKTLTHALNYFEIFKLMH